MFFRLSQVHLDNILEIKKLLLLRIVITCPCPEDILVLTTDASEGGTGAVLSRLVSHIVSISIVDIDIRKTRTISISIPVLSIPVFNVKFPLIEINQT